jgi:hypothetical protein
MRNLWRGATTAFVTVICLLGALGQLSLAASFLVSTVFVTSSGERIQVSDGRSAGTVLD